MNTILRTIQLFSVITLVSTFYFVQEYNFYSQEVSITFVDVDQGDMLLIREGNRVGIIDTGKGTIGGLQLSELTPYFFKTIDFVILTHADLDHSEGLIKLSKMYKVSKVFVNEYSFKQKDTFLSYLLSEGDFGHTQFFDLSKQDKLKFGSFYIDIIWPNERCTFSPNDCSIGTIITHIDNEFAVLSMGDLGSKYEELLIEDIKNISKDSPIYLKLGHHGSKDSSSRKFLEAINPSLAIVSAGKTNSYGHPSARVMDDLFDLQIPHKSTIDQGHIKIIIKSD